MILTILDIASIGMLFTFHIHVTSQLLVFIIYMPAIFYSQLPSITHVTNVTVEHVSY